MHYLTLNGASLNMFIKYLFSLIMKYKIYIIYTLIVILTMQGTLDHHNPENEPDEQQYDEDFEPMNSSVIKQKNNSKIQDNYQQRHKNEMENSFTKENKQNIQDAIDRVQGEKQLKNNIKELSSSQFLKQNKEQAQITIKNGENEKQSKLQNSQFKNFNGNEENLQDKIKQKQIINEEQNKRSKKTKQEDRESQIKDKINKIRRDIIVSKQSIVEDITSIDQFYRENEKQIKNQLQEESVKIKLASLYSNINSQQKRAIVVDKLSSLDINNGKVKIIPIKKDNKIRQRVNHAMEQQKSREEERRRKKEIYILQRQAKKQQQLAEKKQSRMKKNQIQKRIMYEQKFISRRQGIEIPITNQQIKAFEEAFIQQIKQRFNIGKSKVKAASLQKLDKPSLIKKDLKNDQKKKFNKKIYQNQKFKEKIYINLKQQIKEQLQPTYQSIQNDSKQIEGTPISKQKNRSHESAPHLFLPSLYQSKQQINTFYSKDNPKRGKVHILKLSNDNIND